jgi:cytochrome b involved in lipid metabolism
MVGFQGKLFSYIGNLKKNYFTNAMGNIQIKSKKYSRQEVLEMQNGGKIILLVNDKIYDVTEYIDDHPGSREAILRNIDKNNKESYNFHSQDAQKLWEKYFIGYLKTI